MAIFRYIFWLVPVLAIVLYYIAQQQKQITENMNTQKMEFDRDFAQSFSVSKDDKEHFNEVKKEKNKALVMQKTKSDLEDEKSDEIFKKLEKQLGK